MKTFLVHLWLKCRTSFWFIPGLLVLAFAASGVLALRVDERMGDVLQDAIPRLGRVSPESIRSFFTTAAASVLTLAGVTFSATLVALTLAANQFGSRLLTFVIRSLPVQFALGILLGTFVLCLIILGSLDPLNLTGFVPHTAFLVSFLAVLTSLAAFIWFIHHLSISLQADRIVYRVYGELHEAIEHYCPDELPDDREEENADSERKQWDFIEDEVALPSPATGYIQAISFDRLLETATRRRIRCRVIRRPGDFVTAGDDLLAISGETAENSGEDLASELTISVIIGGMRTDEQDFNFSLRQLVEIALRALSPGVNDPFTAMGCIDYLGAALAAVAGRRLPRHVFRDDEGHERLLIKPTTFSELLDTAFDQIRQTAGERTDIARRLLQSLRGISHHATLSSQRQAIKRHADTLASIAIPGASADCDREELERLHRDLRETLEE